MDYKKMDSYKQDQENDVVDLLGKFDCLTDHKSLIKIYDDSNKLDNICGVHLYFCLRGNMDTEKSYLLIQDGNDEIIETIYGSDMELLFQSENVFLAKAKSCLILAVVEVSEYIESLHKINHIQWVQNYI